jgi:hypothetical protein
MLATRPRPKTSTAEVCATKSQIVGFSRGWPQQRYQNRTFDDWRKQIAAPRLGRRATLKSGPGGN